MWFCREHLIIFSNVFMRSFLWVSFCVYIVHNCRYLKFNIYDLLKSFDWMYESYSIFQFRDWLKETYKFLWLVTFTSSKFAVLLFSNIHFKRSFSVNYSAIWLRYYTQNESKHSHSRVSIFPSKYFWKFYSGRYISHQLAISNVLWHTLFEVTLWLEYLDLENWGEEGG